jgi:cobalt/nickel transport system permease protein
MHHFLRIACVMAVGLGSLAALARASESWEGVDKTVVEKFAIQAGHPPMEPFFNTEQGDLLLFLFLLSGAPDRFIAGYAFRALFPPKVTAENPCTSQCEVAPEISSQ